nr:FadR/GntR family transcriptional regulator [uncultured Faecalibacillus sp.]
MDKKKRLSDDIAEVLLSQIVVEKKYLPGDKLPNEIDLSKELGVSRITLREAIRILVTRHVLEIKRGKGTFVREDYNDHTLDRLNIPPEVKMGADDLYEIRLIFEPEIAYYATLRATDKELERINALKNEIEKRILNKKDYAKQEMLFHCSIAQATHNEFMSRLEPVLQESIQKGVFLYEYEHVSNQDIISDNKMIMEFMNARNAEGAKSAMHIHILRAINQLKLEKK